MFDEDQLPEAENSICEYTGLSGPFWTKGHNSRVLGGIWQVIELGQYIMHTNIIIKFDEYWMYTLQLGEQTMHIDWI